VTHGPGRNYSETGSIGGRSDDAQLGSCPSDQVVALN